MTEIIQTDPKSGRHFIVIEGKMYYVYEDNCSGLAIILIPL